MRRTYLLNVPWYRPTVQLRGIWPCLIVLAVAAPSGRASETPLFEMQELFPGRGGRSLVVARDGTLMAFHGRLLRRSADAGKTWGPPREIGPDAGGNAILDEITGDTLLVRPGQGHLWRSADAGQTWSREDITVLPNGLGHGSPDSVPAGAGAMQAGITLQHGKHRGRLLMPARCQPPKGNNEIRWWPYNYNTSIYSDDRGATWQTSAPFPVLGTGEGTLAELSDGRVYYNSREHMSKGNRFIAWSHDGGATWLNASRCRVLPDGMRGDRYGCMGGLVRLPIDGRDILTYSNLDSDGGKFRGHGRQKITVWASFDGAETWPVKRLVFDGPSAYSNLAAGRPHTPTEGQIYLLFEGGREGQYAAVHFARFNLAWLLEGKPTGDGDVPDGQRSGSGTTNAQGEFTLSTFKPEDGAFPGKHNIAIMPKEPPPSPYGGGMMGSDEGGVDQKSYTPLFPARYGLPGTARLTANVSPDQENTYTLELQSE